jgi:hypothetical protein
MFFIAEGEGNLTRHFTFVKPRKFHYNSRLDVIDGGATLRERCAGGAA